MRTTGVPLLPPTSKVQPSPLKCTYSTHRLCFLACEISSVQARESNTLSFPSGTDETTWTWDWWCSPIHIMPWTTWDVQGCSGTDGTTWNGVPLARGNLGHSAAWIYTYLWQDLCISIWGLHFKYLQGVWFHWFGYFLFFMMLFISFTRALLNSLYSASTSTPSIRPAINKGWSSVGCTTNLCCCFFPIETDQSL